MENLCQLKDSGLSCFGCCGNEYNHKKKLMGNIKKNTHEFNKKKSLKLFMVRTTELKPSGICANLVFKDGRFFCPGHPALNHGKDYRELDQYCENDKEDGCDAYIKFPSWSKEKQDKFVAFINGKFNKEVFI